jgi:hypothetical protein
VSEERLRGERESMKGGGGCGGGFSCCAELGQGGNWKVAIQER